MQESKTKRRPGVQRRYFQSQSRLKAIDLRDPNYVAKGTSTNGGIKAIRNTEQAAKNGT